MKSGIAVGLSVILIVAAMSAAVAVEAQDHCFLWRATSVDRSVYLLGSIHYMKQDSYPLNAAIEDAFLNSGVVVFETDIDELDRAADLLIAAGTLDGDETLAGVVPADLYRGLTTRLEAVGASPDLFDKMQPWMVALSLTSFELIRAGYSGSEGIDSHFNTRAREGGKVVEGLESIEFQIALFAEMSPEESVEFLQYTLIELDTMIPLVDQIVVAWKIGAASLIEELMVEGFEGHKALYERLVTQRNLRWLPRIEELFEGDADAMVVVGSLHLVGEQGLIELLRAKGYEVEQL